MIPASITPGPSANTPVAAVTPPPAAATPLAPTPAFAPDTVQLQATAVVPAAGDDKAAALARLKTMQPGRGHDNRIVFGQVSPELYRGRVPSRQDLQDLKAIGVKTVISFLSPEKGEGPRLAQEQADAAAVGIKLISLPWREESPTAEVTTQVNATLAAINNPDNQPVYIHCMHGQDRTGVAVASYDIAHELPWTGDLKSYGFKHKKYPELKAFLEARAPAN